jgi:hypothetical protein
MSSNDFDTYKHRDINAENIKINQLQDQVYCMQRSLATLRKDIPELLRKARIAALEERNRRSWPV